jgi:hypothetical protein
MSVTYRRCFVCGADPAGRWKQPAMMIFIDPHHKNGNAKGARFHCREHVSAEKEKELQQRDLEGGWLRVGGLR